MLHKLTFAVVFILDLFFAVSGLSMLSAGESIAALSFLLLLWFAIWSVGKIYAYQNISSGISFLRFYFQYMIRAYEIYVSDSRTGPNRLFRAVIYFANVVIGLAVPATIFMNALISGIFTSELLHRYAEAALVSILAPFTMLLVVYFFDSRKKVMDIKEKLFRFFSVKMVNLALYAATFLSPVFWLFLAYFTFIGTNTAMASKKSVSN